MANQETEPTTMKILIVDDDKKLCRLVADYLERAADDGVSSEGVLTDREQERPVDSQMHCLERS